MRTQASIRRELDAEGGKGLPISPTGQRLTQGSNGDAGGTRQIERLEDRLRRGVL
jgi:hypothetical protein